MPTRSEQFKADAERAASISHNPAVETPPHEPNGHAAKKATYAREAQADNGRPSRKSTRKSANHQKTDATMVHAQQMKQSTPEAQFARADAHAKGKRPGETR